MTILEAPTRPTAKIVSELLGPVPFGVGLLVGVGAASDDSPWAGAGWGLLGIFFAAVLPYLLTLRLRRDRPRKGHGGRTARLQYLGVALGSAAAGLLLLALLPAPHQVFAVTLTILVGLLAAVGLNTRWPVSNHTSAAAGGAAMLTILYGSELLALYALVAALAWARVVLGRHTVSEAVAGVAVGSVVSAISLSVLL